MGGCGGVEEKETLNIDCGCGIRTREPDGSALEADGFDRFPNPQLRRWGIEPQLSAWKADVLPLDDRRSDGVCHT